ncbi:glycosyltransferase family 2 protein [Rhodopirellula sp. SWK7]|uniref:glycosyltransferase family 2 protein n=1 Tax=Rhodopirellula sp. SWK7 TaxID=595460 RepID=UPI0002BF7B61|nr:glycosyltransferase family A protein [Rhodopirellula sp. SWK7]EMI45380.1 glycosyl transferase, group 2 family protein [Rhodopirellula sp. SWK7]
MHPSPQVSVVIPVYNAEAFLAEAIQSVIDQTFENWELIAVDDGSSDRSLEILHDFAAKDPRIRVLPREHAGICSTRNAGIDASRAKYFAALDNDDAMTPTRLQMQFDFLESHPDYAAVGTAGLLIDVDGDPINDRHFPTSSDDVEAELLAGRNPLMQSSMMFRREAVIAAGGYQDGRNYAEDYDLFLRLTENGKIGNLSDLLMRQRQHISRASAAHYEDQNRVVLLALKDAYARRGLKRELPIIEGSWHPTTPTDYHIRCASDAWDAGNIQSVRKHARAILQQNPLSPRGIELYGRTLMGHRLYSVFATCKAVFRPLKNIR